MKDLGAHFECVCKSLRTFTNDHKFLNIGSESCVSAAIEHVHHRQRQDRCAVGHFCDVAPQRLILSAGGSFSGG